MIRIGTEGTQTSTHIAGVQSASIGASGTGKAVVVQDATGRLGGGIHDSPLPRGFFHGLRVVRSTVSTGSIQEGSCRDHEDVMNLNLGSAVTLDITTSGAGGLDTGAEASDTWYYVYVIGDDTGENPTSGILSTSTTGPTFPSGYNRRRLVGAFRNDASSDFYDFVTTDEGPDKLYLWRESETTLEVLTNGSATTFTNVDLSEFTPASTGDAAGIRYCYMMCNTTPSGGTQDRVVFREDGTTLEPVHRIYANTGAGAEGLGSDTFMMRCSSAGLIEYENSSAAMATDVRIIGYVFTAVVT